MKKFSLNSSEVLAGSLIFTNLLALIMLTLRSGMNNIPFFALLLSLFLLATVSLLRASRYRNRAEDKLTKINSDKEHLQDYINASWQANQKLLQEEKILGIRFMMTGISHEIETPLGNALTSVSVLESLMEKYKNEDHDIQYAMELSRASIEKTIELINKFKDASQIPLNEDRQDFKLAEILNDVGKVKNYEWKNKAVSVLIDCPGEMIINSYPYSLSIVTGVLLDNAYEAYEKKQGEINVRVKRIQNDLEIVIEDRGSGIKPEDLENILDPFYTTSPNRKHMGLGLSVAQNLTESLFQGEMNIKSQWGKGTAVTLILPDVFSPFKVII